MRGAGTDANVFMTLYGDKGKTDEEPLGNATDNFEQGQLDKFKVCHCFIPALVHWYFVLQFSISRYKCDCTIICSLKGLVKNEVNRRCICQL